MPRKPDWIQRIPQALEELKRLHAPVLDRDALQALLGVHRRTGIRLMRRLGGYQAGKTFLVERETLMQQLTAIATGKEYRQEVRRRHRLLEELETARREWEGRKVKIPLNLDAPSPTLLALPPGIHLRPGELRIEFSDAQDLLTQLAEFSQALMNDYEQLTKMIASKTSKLFDI